MLKTRLCVRTQSLGGITLSDVKKPMLKKIH